MSRTATALSVKVRKVAAKFRVSESTARRYLSRGELPPKHDGRQSGRCRDGRWYPSETNRELLPPHNAEIRRALLALRRAKIEYPADHELLDQISKQVSRIWTEAE